MFQTLSIPFTKRPNSKTRWGDSLTIAQLRWPRSKANRKVQELSSCGFVGSLAYSLYASASNLSQSHAEEEWFTHRVLYFWTNRDWPSQFLNFKDQIILSLTQWIPDLFLLWPSSTGNQQWRCSVWRHAQRCSIQPSISLKGLSEHLSFAWGSRMPSVNSYSVGKLMCSSPIQPIQISWVPTIDQTSLKRHRRFCASAQDTILSLVIPCTMEMSGRNSEEREGWLGNWEVAAAAT